MIIKMLLVADPLLVPADGVQVGGGGVGRPAEHLQHQRVEPATIIIMMMTMIMIMMIFHSLLHVHVVISGVESGLIIIPTEPGSYQDDDDDK